MSAYGEKPKNNVLDIYLLDFNYRTPLNNSLMLLHTLLGDVCFRLDTKQLSIRVVDLK